jgi:hypothetical protein
MAGRLWRRVDQRSGSAILKIALPDGLALACT